MTALEFNWVDGDAPAPWLRGRFEEILDYLVQREAAAQPDPAAFVERIRRKAQTARMAVDIDRVAEVATLTWPPLGRRYALPLETFIPGAGSPVAVPLDDLDHLPTAAVA